MAEQNGLRLALPRAMGARARAAKEKALSGV